MRFETHTQINQGKLSATIFPNFQHVKLADTGIIIGNSNSGTNLQSQ